MNNTNLQNSKNANLKQNLDLKKRFSSNIRNTKTSEKKKDLYLKKNNSLKTPRRISVENYKSKNMKTNLMSNSFNFSRSEKKGVFSKNEKTAIFLKNEKNKIFSNLKKMNFGNFSEIKNKYIFEIGKKEKKNFENEIPDFELNLKNKKLSILQKFQEIKINNNLNHLKKKNSIEEKSENFVNSILFESLQNHIGKEFSNENFEKKLKNLKKNNFENEESFLKQKKKLIEEKFKNLKKSEFLENNQKNSILKESILINKNNNKIYPININDKFEEKKNILSEKNILNLKLKNLEVFIIKSNFGKNEKNQFQNLIEKMMNINNKVNLEKNEIEIIKKNENFEKINNFNYENQNRNLSRSDNFSNNGLKNNLNLPSTLKFSQIEKNQNLINKGKTFGYLKNSLEKINTTSKNQKKDQIQKILKMRNSNLLKQINQNFKNLTKREKSENSESLTKTEKEKNFEFDKIEEKVNLTKSQKLSDFLNEKIDTRSLLKKENNTKNLSVGKKKISNNLKKKYSTKNFSEREKIEIFDTQNFVKKINFDKTSYLFDKNKIDLENKMPLKKKNSSEKKNIQKKYSFQQNQKNPLKQKFCLKKKIFSQKNIVEKEENNFLEKKNDFEREKNPEDRFSLAYEKNPKNERFSELSNSQNSFKFQLKNYINERNEKWSKEKNEKEKNEKFEKIRNNLDTKFDNLKEIEKNFQNKLSFKKIIKI